jgi:VIT1/CCC1 family predicted Fe2+/Mn2+ transporter
MNNSRKKGFSFGLTSGIITTLGLIVGLHSSTHSTLVIIGGILVIAVADAMSDALGMHISEEAECKHTRREIWESTLTTFSAKLVFASFFIIPFLFFALSAAILISIAWGISLIIVFSYYLAKSQGLKPRNAIFEHVLIAIFVIFATHYIGDWVATFE